MKIQSFAWCCLIAIILVKPIIGLKYFRTIVFQSDGSQTDSTWWENDGIVNFKSMRGPIGESIQPLVSSYDDLKKIKPGIWNSFKKINLDHYQSVGHMVSKKQRLVVDSLYINHAKILMSLPK